MFRIRRVCAPRWRRSVEQLATGETQTAPRRRDSSARHTKAKQNNMLDSSRENMTTCVHISRRPEQHHREPASHHSAQLPQRLDALLVRLLLLRLNTALVVVCSRQLPVAGREPRVDPLRGGERCCARACELVPRVDRAPNGARTVTL